MISGYNASPPDEPVASDGYVAWTKAAVSLAIPLLNELGPKRRDRVARRGAPTRPKRATTSVDPMGRVRSPHVTRASCAYSLGDVSGPKASLWRAFAEWNFCNAAGRSGRTSDSDIDRRDELVEGDRTVHRWWPAGGACQHRLSCPAPLASAKFARFSASHAPADVPSVSAAQPTLLQDSFRRVDTGYACSRPGIALFCRSSP
jgi:hypothetical protein